MDNFWKGFEKRAADYNPYTWPADRVAFLSDPKGREAYVKEVLQSDERRHKIRATDPPSSPGKWALGGGLAGAGVGALVGLKDKKSLIGSGIGGLLGAGLGGLSASAHNAGISSSKAMMDRPSKERKNILRARAESEYRAELADAFEDLAEEKAEMAHEFFGKRAADLMGAGPKATGVNWKPQGLSTTSGKPMLSPQLPTGASSHVAGKLSAMRGASMPKL